VDSGGKRTAKGSIHAKIRDEKKKRIRGKYIEKKGISLRGLSKREIKN